MPLSNRFGLAHGKKKILGDVSGSNVTGLSLVDAELRLAQSNDQPTRSVDLSSLGGGSIGGTATTGRVAYGTNTNQIGSSPFFLFNTTDKTVELSTNESNKVPLKLKHTESSQSGGSGLSITNHSDTAKLDIVHSNSGDTNNIWGYTNIPLQIATNNTARMVIAGGGNVGIGTNAPSQLLDVLTGDGVAIRRENTNSAIYGPSLYIQRKRTTGDLSSGDLIGNLTFQPYKGDYDNRAATISAAVEGTLATDTTPGRLMFSTAAAGANTVSERMRIDSAGNVGIGDTGPISKLSVAGKMSLTSESTTPAQPADGKGYIYSKSDGKLYWRSYDISEVDLTADTVVSPGGSTSQIQYNDGGSFAGSSLFTFTTSLGPQLKLTSATDARPTFTMENTNANANASQLIFNKDSSSPADGDEIGQITFTGKDSSDNDTTYADILVQSATVANTSEEGVIRFKTMTDSGLTNALVVSGSSVGIGTLSPGAKLDVDGNLRVRDSHTLAAGDSDDLYLYHDGNSTLRSDTGIFNIVQNTSDNLNITANGGDVVIDSNIYNMHSGKVGIGNSSPNFNVDVLDNAADHNYVAVTNTSAGTSSVAGFRLQSQTTDGLFVGHADNRTVSRYGITVAGYTEILTTAGNGLLIGNSHNAPIVFGTNNAEQLRIADNLITLGDGVVLAPHSSDDFTIDSPNDIVLDYAGNNLVFKSDGTTFGKINNNNAYWDFDGNAGDSYFRFIPWNGGAGTTAYTYWGDGTHNQVIYVRGTDSINTNSTTIANTFIQQYDGAGNSDTFIQAGGDSYFLNQLGLGTNNPSEQLQLKGDSTYLSILAADGSEGVRLGTASSGRGLLYLKTSTGGNSIYLDAAGDSYINGGDLGIGTASPNSKLEVLSTSNPQIRASYNGSNYLDIYASNGTGYIKQDGRFRASSSTARYFFYGNATSTARAEMFLSAGGDIANKRLSSFLYLLRGYEGKDGAGIYFGKTVSGSNNEGSAIASGREGTEWYAGLNYTGGGVSDEWILGTDYRTTSGSGADGYTPVITAQKSGAYGQQGKVGINTVNPAATFDIRQRASSDGLIVDTDYSNGDQIRVLKDGNTSLLGKVVFDGTNMVVGAWGTGGGIRFWNNGEGMRLTGDKLIIGGTVPGETLHVVGTSRVTGKAAFGGSTLPTNNGISVVDTIQIQEKSSSPTATTGWGTIWVSGSDPNKLYFTDDDGTAHDLTAGGGSTSPGGSDTQIQYNNGGAFGGASALTYDDTNDRLGINVASPVRKLDVNSAGIDIVARFASTDNRASIQLSDDDTNRHIVTENSAISLGPNSSLHSNNLNIVGSPAKVGIGTTEPSYKLDVYGDVNVTGSLRFNDGDNTRIFSSSENLYLRAHNDMYFNIDTPNDSDTRHFIFRTNTSTEIMRLGEDKIAEFKGAVGIGLANPSVTRQSEGLTISGTSITSTAYTSSTHKKVTSLFVPSLGSGSYILAGIGGRNSQMGDGRAEPPIMVIGDVGTSLHQTTMNSGRAVSLVLAGTAGYNSGGQDYGNFGSLLFHGNSNWSGNARRWLISNAFRNSGAGDMGLGFASETSAGLDPTVSGSTPSVVMSTDSNYGVAGKGGLIVGNKTHINSGKVTIVDADNNKQLTLAHDGSNYTTFKVASNGGLTIDAANDINLDSYTGITNYLYRGTEKFRITAGASSPVVLQPKASGYDLSLAAQDGTSVLHLDSTDKFIGIGTSNPSAKLEVKNASSNWAAYVDQNDTGNLAMKIEGTYGLGIETSGQYPLDISTASSADALRMLDNGNLGIGTTSPSAKFEVMSATNSYEQARFQWDASNYLGVFVNSGGDSQLESKTGHLTLKTDTSAHNVRVDTKGDFRVDLGDSNGGYTTRIRAADNSPVFMAKSNGLIGIGTESPDDLLHVLGGDVDPSIKLQNNRSGHNGYYLMEHRGSTLKLQSTGSAVVPIRFTIQNSDIMRIDDTGLGIGTDAPSSSLHVSGGAIQKDIGESVYLRAIHAGFDSNAILQHQPNTQYVKAEATSPPGAGAIPTELPLAESKYTGLEITVMQRWDADPEGALTVQKQAGSSDVIYEGGSNSASATVSIAAYRGANKTFVIAAAGVWVVKD